jgi:NAD(P)-dependent dehydrogenase (short-subunit alcohol dehydrogenase family)
LPLTGTRRASTISARASGPMVRACTHIIAISPRAIRSTRWWTLRAHGRIDILVNNAGIPDNYQGVGDLSLEVWDRQLAVNLVAPMRAMRRTVPAMVAQGGGSIVNIGSIASTSGAAAGAAYVAVKHGLLGLNRNTAWMYARHGIRCNLIKPGWTETTIASNITGPISEEGRDRIREFVNLTPYRLAVEDIATAASPPLDGSRHAPLQQLRKQRPRPLGGHRRRPCRMPGTPGRCAWWLLLLSGQHLGPDPGGEPPA